MTDNEKIQSFGDMVDAVERLTKPIQEENLRLHDQLNKVHKQMWWERLILGIIILAFILLAYLTPVEMDQSQNLTDSTQNQSYSEGVTGGK